MKKKILLLLIMIIPFFVRAEELNFNWETDIVPAISGENEIAVLGVMSDGSTVIMFNNGLEELLGIKNDDGKESALVKYDKDGNIVWKKIAGKDLPTEFYDALITKNDEIITVGRAAHLDEFIYDGKRTGAMITKYDKDGNLIWQRGWGVDMNLPGPMYANSSEFTRVLMTKDEEYIAIGKNNCVSTPQSYNDKVDRTCNENQLIVKYDKDGNILWQRSWSDNKLSGRMHKAKLLKDGSFVLAGELYSTSYRDRDIVLAKFDSDGTMQWQKTWGGNDSDTINKIIISDNGDVIMHVNTNSDEIDGRTIKYEQVILRVSKAGEVISWEEIPEFYSMVETENFYWLSSAEFDNEDNPQPHLYLKKYDKNWNLKQKLILDEQIGDNLKGSILFDLVAAKGDKVVGVGYRILVNAETGEYEEFKELIIKYDNNMNIVYEKIYENVLQNANINTQNIIKNGNSLYTLCLIADNSLESYDNILLKKYSIIYNITEKETKNGEIEISKKNSEAIINPTPNKGYEVDEIIVKDAQDNEIQATLQADETYSFDLYSDVTVEVTFKEKIENPKTGVIDLMTILFVGIFMSLSGFFIVKKYNERLEF